MYKFIVLAWLAVVFSGCDTSDPPEQSNAARAERERLEADARFLADDALEGHEVGTWGV